MCQAHNSTMSSISSTNYTHKTKLHAIILLHATTLIVYHGRNAARWVTTLTVDASLPHLKNHSQLHWGVVVMMFLKSWSRGLTHFSVSVLRPVSSSQVATQRHLSMNTVGRPCMHHWKQFTMSSGPRLTSKLPDVASEARPLRGCTE